MKIVSRVNSKQIKSFIDQLPAVFDRGGTTIYKQRNEVKVFDVDGESVNVKRYKVPHFVNRIVYTFFRLTKPERSYQYALKLRKIGVDTPEPYAYILTKKNGLLHYSYYISEQVAYEHTMYEFGQGGIVGREPIIKAFATYTADLHERGIYHKDYSPGNILFQEQDGQIRFCLVDINRMRFGEVSIKEGCANFARLWGQEDFFLLLAKEYACVRNIDVDTCIKWMLYYRTKFWKKYAKKRQIPFSLK